MESNNEQAFSSMEIDAIGEIMNISLGSSATSVSELLEQPVNITTPRVKVMREKEFDFESYDPAVGVEINYVSGLSGKNIMILKESDVKVIVGCLLQTDYSDHEFVMDEMSVGAICEVMNQMMGASSTALSQFLNRSINISPPNSFTIDNADLFKKKYFDSDETIVAVYFNLLIGDLVNSEFISVMSVELAKEMISSFGLSAEPEETPVPELAPTPVPPTVPAPAPAPAPTPAPIPPMPQQAYMPPQPAPQPPTYIPPQQAPAYYAPQPTGMPYNQPPMSRGVQPTMGYNVSQANYQSFDEEDAQLTNGQNSNLNMILSVPLQITVEIGRTSRKIKEILDFSPGSIVELSKQAGSQVDVFVNGQAIAKGDIVVVDDYYAVRITEVSSSSEIMKLL